MTQTNKHGTENSFSIRISRISTDVLWHASSGAHLHVQSHVLGGFRTFNPIDEHNLILPYAQAYDKLLSTLFENKNF